MYLFRNKGDTVLIWGITELLFAHYFNYPFIETRPTNRTYDIHPETIHSF